MNTWMLPIKAVLISAGVASLALAIKLSVPIAVEGIPSPWSSVVSWLKPPYLYIIINGIIITIAASSRFHQTKSEKVAESEHYVSIKAPSPQPSFAPFSISSQPYVISSSSNTSTVEESIPVVDDEAVVAEIFTENSVVGELKSISPNMDGEIEKQVTVEHESEAEGEAEYEDIHVVASMGEEDKIPEEEEEEVPLEYLLPIREKPLVSSRFSHRKPIRNNPEGTGLRRVARPKRHHDTLESTWRAITEGRHVPLTRHVVVGKKPANSLERVASVNRIRKDMSVGQEELNRRVEAFINKFNEDMRMQRQESMNRFMEMINRGV